MGTPLLTREAPGGDGRLLQRPPPALLITDTFIPAQNTTTCTMRPLGKAAAASGKAADGTRLRQSRIPEDGSVRAAALGIEIV